MGEPKPHRGPRRPEPPHQPPDTRPGDDGPRGTSSQGTDGHGGQPAAPPPSGAGQRPWASPPSVPPSSIGLDPADEPYRTSAARELLEGAVTAVAVAVTGVVFGLLWLWLAPRVPLVATDEAVLLRNTEGEEAMGADGVFVLLGLGMGAVTGTLVYWLRRRGGVGLVVGLTLGGLLGSLLAWRLGVWLGPTQDVAAHAREVGPGKVFDAPLKLRATAALLAWPVAAVLVHLVHTALFRAGPVSSRGR